MAAGSDAIGRIYIGHGSLEGEHKKQKDFEKTFMQMYAQFLISTAELIPDAVRVSAVCHNVGGAVFDCSGNVRENCLWNDSMSRRL